MTAPASDPVDRKIALMIAVISALAALFGAGTGGLISYLTTSNQIEAGQRSEERELRKATYSDFVVAAEKCREVVDDIYVRKAVSVEEGKRYDQLYNELREKRTVLNLLGSRRLAVLSATYSGAITDQFTNSIDITRDVPNAESRVEQLQDALVDAEYKFYEEAKRDLELN